MLSTPGCSKALSATRETLLKTALGAENFTRVGCVCSVDFIEYLLSVIAVRDGAIGRVMTNGKVALEIFSVFVGSNSQ